MLDFCDELACSEEYTYITAGFNAGLRELYRFYQENPSRHQVLVLISDGKNNPPKTLEKEDIIQYDDIRDRFFSKFEPGKDFFVSYITLKNVRDPKLADFVRTRCRGNEVSLLASDDAQLGTPTSETPSLSVAEIRPNSGLHVERDQTIDFGSAWLPTTVEIPLLVRRLRGYAGEQAIRVTPLLMDFGATRQLLAEVSPAEIRVGAEVVRERITLSISGVWDEEINGALLFEPKEQTMLIINPPQIPFRFGKPPKFVIRKATADKNGWKPIDWLTVGPLQPNGECHEQLILDLEGSAPPEGIDVRAVPDIRLPDGVTCTAKVILEQLFTAKTATVLVKAAAEKNVALKQNTQFTGKLRFDSSVASLSYSQGGVIPLKIFTASHEDGTPPPRPVGTAPLVWQWASENQILLIIGAAFLSLVVLLGVVVRIRLKIYSSRLNPLEGLLVVLENPLSTDFENIDLKELSEKSKKSKLIIGSDPASHILIPHDSVDKSHAQIRSGKEGKPTPVYIRGLGVSDVLVNNFIIDKEIKLEDRDIIDIGEFQFLYSNSYLKQVVVHYKDGDVRYGVLLTWNIDEEGFVLQPEGKGAEDLQIYVPFKDLKAVFFVKDFDKEIARKINLSEIHAKKDHIIVRFQDGERIEGYTIRDYDPKTTRFFIMPKIEPGKEENNVCVLVERRFTQKVKVLGKHR